MIERQRGLGGGGFGHHRRCVVAERRVRMHLLHQSGEIRCRIDLPDCLVKGDQRVLDGARSFDRDQFRYRLLSGGKSVVLHLLEGGYIGLGGPHGRLRDLRCGARHEQRRKQ